MLSAMQRHDLPALAAQVTAQYPGVTLALAGSDAVLTIGPDVTEEYAQAARHLVAQTIADFRLITSDDHAPAELPPGWLETHRRGNHHLDIYHASAFR